MAGANVMDLVSEEAIQVRRVLEAVLLNKSRYPDNLALRHLAQQAIGKIYSEQIMSGKTPMAAAIEAAVWFGREEIQKFGC